MIEEYVTLWFRHFNEVKLLVRLRIFYCYRELLRLYVFGKKIIFHDEPKQAQDRCEEILLGDIVVYSSNKNF